MNTNRALTEIWDILYAKCNQEKTIEDKRAEAFKVLQKLEEYQYNWGRRQGMFASINHIEELLNKESENL